MREAQTSAPQVPRQTRGPERGERTTEPTGWVGWVFFGAMMLILLGSFQAIAGLVALFDRGYYLVSRNGLLVHVDYTAWGWVHLIIGLVALAAGIGLMTGRMWARVLGVVIALLSAIVNLGFLAAYPLWSITMIALDVIVIYAITAHGSEVKAAEY
jgi:hypothetical protein